MSESVRSVVLGIRSGAVSSIVNTLADPDCQRTEKMWELLTALASIATRTWEWEQMADQGRVREVRDELDGWSQVVGLIGGTEE